MPHTPLRVLRGEDNMATVQDELHEAFQAPTTTDDDDENAGSTDSNENEDLEDDDRVNSDEDDIPAVNIDEECEGPLLVEVHHMNN